MPAEANPRSLRPNGEEEEEKFTSECGGDAVPPHPDNMKIIDANHSRTAIIPTDTVYTEGAVKVIIENVVQAMENGRTAQEVREKRPGDWL